MLHRLAQGARAPGRQHQPPRPVRISEIVNVAPVGGRRSRRRLGLQQLLDQRALAGARRAEGEDVEAAVANAEAGADRFDCALLSDELRQIRKLFGGREGQLVHGAAAPQLRGGKRHPRRDRHRAGRVGRDGLLQPGRRSIIAHGWHGHPLPFVLFNPIRPVGP
jgi:hypothetical protein